MDFRLKFSHKKMFCIETDANLELGSNMTVRILDFFFHFLNPCMYYTYYLRITSNYLNHPHLFRACKINMIKGWVPFQQLLRRCIVYIM